MTNRQQGGDGTSVVDRLRQRKVVQWGLAYAAGAWGLLQGLGYISGLYDWPRQYQQIALLLFLVGLPVALTLAWFHGDRGEHRVGRTELAILTLLFLLGGGLFWRYQHARIAPESSAAAPATIPSSAAPIPTDHSIAVLPFVDMSQAHDQEYFSDGISEELLNLLAQVPQLRVIARTSSFSFKGKEVDVATIAKTLSVANVLEGSVRKSGDKLRITAQLIRASDSSHLWSQTYDRQMTDVFKVQDEIAAAVVDELKIKLLAAAPTSKVTNPNAYALFLQARQIERRYSAEAFTQSIALYQQALALDPIYAPAWVGLAGMYVNQGNEGLRSADTALQLARSAINRALEIDPEYAPAHALLGWIAAFFDHDMVEAAQRVKRALALEPDNLEIIDCAAEVGRRLGRMDEVISIGKYQISRDPVNAFGHFDLGLAYRYSGRLNEAIAELRTVLKLQPDYVYARTAIGEALLMQGETNAALTEILQEADENSRLYGLAVAYYAAGRQAEADAALTQLIQKYGTTAASNIASIFAYRGEADRAFEWLDKAVRYHDPSVGSIAYDPMLAKIHDDPRWSRLLRRLGIAPEQLSAIGFDVKLPNDSAN